MFTLTFVLWLNASNFDETELKTIITMFLVGGGAESVYVLTGKRKAGPTKPPHPMWNMLRLAIYMSTLCIVLYVNAQHFDKTEGKTIIWMFVVGAGSEGVGQIVSRLMGKKIKDEDATQIGIIDADL